MGAEMCVACRECGYMDCYTTGVGMMYGNPESVVDLVHWRRRDRVRQIIRNHRVVDNEYEHRVYRCAKCDRLCGRFYIRLVYDEGEVYETKFSCWRCRKPLARIGEEQIPEMPCPGCRKHGLELFPGVMWDLFSDN